MEIKKILVPTDFTDASSYGLEYALNIAEKFNSELHLVHVMFDETYLSTFHVLKGAMQEYLNEIETAAKENLDNFTVPTLQNFKHEKILLKGVPYLEISKYVEEKNIDLIVVGTFKKTSLEHIVYGSTSEKLLNRTKCPILVAKVPSVQS